MGKGPRTAIISAVALSLLGVFAPSAGALTVGVTPLGPDYAFGHGPWALSTEDYYLRISDEGDGRNQVAVTVESDPATLVVTDSAAPVVVEAGCDRTADGHGARCPLPWPRPDARPTLRKVTIDLGAGDDELLFGAPAAGGTVTGNDGADRLDAAAGAALEWDGGAGPDYVNGPDVTATYTGRVQPLRLTVGAGGADDGAAGEGDEIGAVRGVTGGEAADTITGDGAVNMIDGRAGDDHLDGGDGDDVLVGGRGSDTISGGTGNDTLTDEVNDYPAPVPTGADRLDGGGGDDSLIAFDDGRPDVYIGGPGNDSWDHRALGAYAQRVTVSLDGKANDGRKGERDNLTGLEDVTIIAGTLIGSPRADHLTITGPDGKSLVDGRGGDDVITGGGRLVGGAGRDSVFATVPDAHIDLRDGRADARVDCADKNGGSAPPERLRRDRQDTFGGDCWSPADFDDSDRRGLRGLKVVGEIYTRVVVPRRGAITVPVVCKYASRCRGTLTVRAGGRTIGHRRLNLKRDERRRLRVVIRRPQEPRSCGKFIMKMTTVAPPGAIGPARTTIGGWDGFVIGVYTSDCRWEKGA